MLVKSLSYKSTNSYSRLINYLTSPPDHSILRTWYLKGDVAQWVSQFKRDEKLRRHPKQLGRSNVLIHDILSFSSKSTPHLNEEKMKALSEEYIRLKGTQAQAVAVLHRSEAHQHVHILSNSVCHDTGLANRNTKSHYASIKQDLEIFQKGRFPELADSICEHGKGQSFDRNPHFVQAHKDEIARVLQESLAESSLPKVEARLAESNYTLYSRGQFPSGVTTPDGRKFRFRRLGIDRNQIIELCNKQRYIESLKRVRQTSLTRSR